MSVIGDFAFRVLGTIIPRLPLSLTRRLMGAACVGLAGAPTGWRSRITRNLCYIYPDMDLANRKTILASVPRNIGYTFAELFSGRRFVDLVCREPLMGPGVSAFNQCHRERLPAFLVTAHIGNYDALRAALVARGYDLGGLYRPMNNRVFNEVYLRAISTFGPTLFSKDKRGLAKMLRHLRRGGMVGVVNDQQSQTGTLMQFCGKPAKTSLSFAELSIKHNIPFFPCFGIRRPDGGFDLIVEAEIPRTTPVEMMAIFNSLLEAMIAKNPDQWLWTHQRWKA